VVLNLNNMARREVIAGTRREVGGVQQPSDSLGRYLEPQIIPFIQNLLNIPQMYSQASQELKQSGPFAAPSPELRGLMGGTTKDTGSRLMNSILDALKITQTSTRAGAEVGSGAALIKALWPYLTYSGLAKFNEKLRQLNPNYSQGSDIQKSLTEQLTGGNKLGNIGSDVETTVNDLLTRRMPGGYQSTGTYGAGDLGQLAQNVGKFENGYISGTPGSVFRTGVTYLIKNIAPETQIPYKVLSTLSKIPEVPIVNKIPFLGPAISPKNPWTWLGYLTAGKGALGAVTAPFRSKAPQ
jgi:hypothetical protein